MPNPKITIYLPQAVLDALDQWCLKTTGAIKNTRSVFVIQAIVERLERERKNNAKNK